MDGWITIGAKIDTNSFDAQIDYIEQEMQEIEYKLEQADKGFEVGDVTKLEAKYEKLSNQLSKLIKKKNELSKTNTTGLQNQVKSINNSLTKTISKVGAWTLAIFGVRSAYLGIRQAISYVSQYNEQMANQIESIKYTLAMGFEPVLTSIVNTIYTLVQYVGYLAKAWFNVDLFANASAKSAKAAANATKSMAGFDTANKLSDSSSSTSSPTAMSALPDSEIPEWMQWIKDHGEEIAGIITAITTAILLLKLGVDGILGLGIGLILGGIVTLITSIVSYVENPCWENLSKILEGLAIVLAGVAVAMIAVNAANPVGWIILAIAAVVALVAIIIKYWDEIKAVFIVVGKWIYDNVIKPVADYFVGLWNDIKGAFSMVGSFFKGVFDGAVNAIKTAFNGIVTFFKTIWSTIKTVFTTIGTVAGNAVSTAFKTVVNAVLKTVESVINTPIKAINGLLSIINKVPGVNLSKLSTISLPRLAVGGIVNNPGRGVPVGGAIAGEAGREGVLPLTDSNTMAQLGAEIGKWINVNVDLTTKLDSRVLSRSLEKVQSNNNFARNGV